MVSVTFEDFTKQLRSKVTNVIVARFSIDPALVSKKFDEANSYLDMRQNVFKKFGMTIPFSEVENLEEEFFNQISSDVARKFQATDI